MISKKKVLRDLIVLIIVSMFGYVVWVSIISPRVDMNKPTMNPHDGMMGMSGIPSQSDGSVFKTNSNAPAMRIEGTTYTLGEIDSLAKTTYMMMSGGQIGLNRQILNLSRSEAMRRLLLDAVVRKSAEEFGIHVTNEDVDRELNSMIAEQGGIENFRNLLKQFNKTEADQRKRVEKDIFETRVTEKIYEAMGIQNESETNQTEAFNTWLESEAMKLEVEVIADELMEVFAAPSEHSHVHENGMSDDNIHSSQVENMNSNSDENHNSGESR